MRIRLFAFGSIFLMLCAFAWFYFLVRAPLAQDVRDLSFRVSGTRVTLEDGLATAKTALGGAEDTTIRYFGNELSHDIDGDGVEDKVFLITQDTAAGVTYFYLVGALMRDGGYLGTHAVLLGDNISPQTTNKGEGRTVIVNYAERGEGASIGRSLYLVLDTDTLEFGELVQNFEGESR